MFTCTWQGIPLLYSGQESPNIKRLKFFDKDAIEWKDPLQLHDFYTALLQLRNRNKAITEGETFILPAQNDGELMAFLRKKDENIVLVLLNISDQNRLSIHIQNSWLQGNFTNIFSGLNFTFTGNDSFELQGGEYLVYEKVLH